MASRSRSLARALYFVAPGEVELRDERISPGEGSLLVESSLIGISHGTEMLLYRGEQPRYFAADQAIAALQGTLEYPLKYGYINAGLTRERGRVFAFYPHQDRFYAPREELIELPSDLDDRDALFLPSMETALAICHDCAAVPGECVLVVGQGVVGLLVAEILLRQRLGPVITVDSYELRREASRAIGCEALLAQDPEARKRIFEITKGRGVDHAVNVSGSADGLQLAIDALAFGASAIEASWYGSRGVTLSLGEDFHRKRLSIRSCQVSTIAPGLSGRWSKERRLAAALDLVDAVRPARYITHTIPLDRASDAFDLIAFHPEKTIQVALEP